MSELMELGFRQTIKNATKEELEEALVELVCYFSLTNADTLQERIKGRSDKANEIVIQGLTIMATKKLKGGKDEHERHGD